MPPQTDWQARLNAVDWPRFHTIYGAAGKVPEQIERLHSADETIALAAAADLQAGLCHRHVQIASAALPAFPFIMETLPLASERVTAEILEMLAGFAITTNRVGMARFASAVGKRPMPPPGWVEELRRALQMALPRIAAYATHENCTISEFARMFVDEMGKDVSAA
ncbi:MAG: hypothetical protein ABSF64_28325 [Bryobacteraceae bacterium]|jgi:hypothetical protein